MRTKYTLIGLTLSFYITPLFAQFEVNNDAVDLGGGYYRLTQNVLNQAGSVWYKVQHDLNDPLNIEGQMYFGNDDAGADGIAFVLQNNCLSAGSIGGGIGYAGMPGNSIAVEFDTYENIDGSGDQNNNDPNYDHLAIFRSGTVDHASVNNLYGPVQIHSTQTDVENGVWYDFRINYDPATTTLSVYFDNSLRISYNSDILNTIFAGDPYVYWGFTSSTGGFSNEQQIYIDASSSTYTLSDSTICTGSVTVTLPPLSRYSGENLALGKTAFSSSDEAAGTPAMNVLDGNSSSRWSSQFSDPQWIYIDLGAETDVDSVILNWEGAYGTQYYIQTSTDATNWTNEYHETAGDGGIDKIYFTATNIRYVRMYGLSRATGYGYSLWEFEVYGKPKYIWSPDDGSIDNIYSESPTFTPTATTTYTVLIPDPCNGPTPYNMTITVDCPMPVEFLTFSVQKNNQTSLLQWTTSYENNSGYFEIERSSDGIYFYPIGSIDASGSSTSQLQYSFTDHNPENGINYYRIKETDLDGSHTYSSVRTISFGESFAHAYSDDWKIILTVSSGYTQTVYYKIIAMNGKEVLNGCMTPTGKRSYEIENISLSDACYIVHIYSEEEHYTEKIILK